MYVCVCVCVCVHNFSFNFRLTEKLVAVGTVIHHGLSQCIIFLMIIEDILFLMDCVWKWCYVWDFCFICISVKCSL